MGTYASCDAASKPPEANGARRYGKSEALRGSGSVFQASISNAAGGMLVLSGQSAAWRRRGDEPKPSLVA